MMKVQVLHRNDDGVKARWEPMLELSTDEQGEVVGKANPMVLRYQVSPRVSPLEDNRPLTVLDGELWLELLPVQMWYDGGPWQARYEPFEGEPKPWTPPPGERDEWLARFALR